MARETRRRRRSTSEETPHEEYVGRAREALDVPETDDTDDDGFEPSDDGFEGSEKEPETAPTKTQKSERRSGGGWDAFNKKIAARSNIANRVRFSQDDTVVVKFLEDEPFAVWEQYFVGDRPQGQQKVFVVPFDADEDPLAEIGLKPAMRAAFNVVVLYNEGLDEVDPAPEVTVLEAPPGLAKTLAKRNDDPRQGPLSAHYWGITQYKADNGFLQYSVDFVKTRDVQEDFQVEPLMEDEIEEFEDSLLSEEDYVTETPLSTLREVAKEVANGGSGSDDDDERPSPRRARGRRR